MAGVKENTGDTFTRDMSSVRVQKVVRTYLKTDHHA